MYYKIANIANRNLIEDALGATFKFPHVYKPKKIIDGTTESVIPILTSENNNKLQFAIWGMLPEYFKGDWKPYQTSQNTLNIKSATLKKHLELFKNSVVKRCLIPITGYMDYKKIAGEVTPYMVSHTSTKPFCVAGIYNQLEDGYFTCSIITTKRLEEAPNAVSQDQPAILDRNLHNDWINPEIDTLEALNFLDASHNYPLATAPAPRPLLPDYYSEDDEELGLEDAV